jgi:hypothetical protein
MLLCRYMSQCRYRYDERVRDELDASSECDAGQSTMEKDGHRYSCDAGFLLWSSP